MELERPRPDGGWIGNSASAKHVAIVVHVLARLEPVDVLTDGLSGPEIVAGAAVPNYPTREQAERSMGPGLDPLARSASERRRDDEKRGGAVYTAYTA
jgi:hypothetical protein